MRLNTTAVRRSFMDSGLVALSIARQRCIRTCHSRATASAYILWYQVRLERNSDVVRKRLSKRGDVGMGESVNCVLLVTYVLVVSTSLAQGDGEPWVPIKFPSEDGKPSVPQTSMARFAPRDDDPVVFTHVQDHTTSPADEYATQDPTRGSLQIPLDLIQCLNSIENVTELGNCINTEIQPDYADPETEIGFRFGVDDDNVDRKAAVIPKSATCAPELVTVPLQNSDDKTVFYYPSCTRVERCGGCCSHDLLSCQPTVTEVVTFQVIETKYEGGSKLNYKGKKYITVEQHIKCKCDCKVKEEHCNALQRYEKSECRCLCVNMDEEQKCIAENDTKLWDTKECQCACRYTKECSTGFYFDQKTCNCSPVPIIRRRISDSHREVHRRWEENPQINYEVTPRSIVPLNKVTERADED